MSVIQSRKRQFSAFPCFSCISSFTLWESLLTFCCMPFIIFMTLQRVLCYWRGSSYCPGTYYMLWFLFVLADQFNRLCDICQKKGFYDSALGKTENRSLPTSPVIPPARPNKRIVMPVPAMAEPVIDHQKRFQAAVDVIQNLPKNGK